MSSDELGAIARFFFWGEPEVISNVNWREKMKQFYCSFCFFFGEDYVHKKFYDSKLKYRS